MSPVPGSQPDRETLRRQATQGIAVLRCPTCGKFWREFADRIHGWAPTHPDHGSCNPGRAGCPSCGSIYVVWENFPEAQALTD